MIDFFEFSNEMLCLADQRGYFTRVNKAWTKTLGWSAEELTSRPFIDFVHPDDLAATIQESTLLQSGSHETISFENRYRCRDGSYRWLAWKAVLAPGTQQLVATARDVTGQKLQAQALAESEERFRLLASNAPIGIAQSTLEGSIFYANSMWCELAGVTQAEASGLAWKTFIHPDDLQAVIDHWQSYVQAGQDMPAVEFRFLHGNGDIRWASSTAAMLRDAAGRVTGQIATLQDITQRKAVELRFRGIYEQAPLGIALLDSHSGRFLQLNPRYEQIIGRTEEQMVQLTFHDITYPEDLAEDLKNMELLLAGKIRSFQMEKRLVRGDGSLMWASLTVVPMWQAGETPMNHLAIVEDITERKAMEDMVRESEERFRAFMDNTPVYAWAKDEEGRFVYINKACEELHQMPFEEVRGKTNFDISPKVLAQGYWEADQKVLATGKPVSLVEQPTLSEQDPRYWFTTKFLFHDRRNSRFVGGVAIEITELKETEQALRSEQELLRNLIEVQENERRFLCHEIHDGLIQYAVGALMSMEGYLGNQATAHSLSKIEEAIADLRRGIEDGRRVIRGIRPAVLDDSGLEAAIDDLVGQFANSGILVASKCEPGIGRLPNSLQTTLYRVVQEALNNAKKHSGTDVVRIELKKVDGELLLEIRDFGCGFDLPSARRRGFGLLGMAERVRLLGGECLIESEQEVGTRISVRLPIPVVAEPIRG
jgi:PAS domain S-box-containing protein